jgi:peptidoglycan/LPS O-acetylase OafA/YrhL
MPLYLVAMCILWLIVADLSHFKFQEPVQAVLHEMGLWLIFVRPDINGISPTRIITAGVTWSLAFEWLFYFTLALFGRAFFSIRTSLIALVIPGIGLIAFIYILIIFYPYNAWWRLSPFPGGILAAFLSRNKTACRIAAGPVASCCILALFAPAVIFFYTAYEFIPYLLIIAGFQGIACGNDLFGILTNRYSRLLGQISYSIYLLHGLILFAGFRYVLGFGRAGQFSGLGHWVTVAGFSVVVVILCCMTYKWIELPGMRVTAPVAERLRKSLKDK